MNLSPAGRATEQPISVRAGDGGGVAARGWKKDNEEEQRGSAATRQRGSYKVAQLGKKESEAKMENTVWGFSLSWLYSSQTSSRCSPQDGGVERSPGSPEWLQVTELKNNTGAPS